MLKKYHLKLLFLIFIAIASCSTLIITISAKAQTSNEAKRSVPFSEVNIDSGLMHDYMKLVICEVIPTAIENVEKPNGGMDNIKWCANWHNGGQWHAHEGEIYVDSDVHKVLESMCMALDTPTGGDKEIENAQDAIKAKLEEWIPYYQKAPEQEGSQYPGYFDSFWSLDTEHEKYSNTDQHELYCQGHFIEAAVAHYRYSKHKNPDNPDLRLLNVAINSADHIVKTFGTDEGQRKQIPGHQEIELALMKLARLCQEIGGSYAEKSQGYIDKAAFFLSVRGDYTNRTVDDDQNKREYYQDHALIENQTEAVGHAVRAQYMYTAMCELASINPDYAAKYDNALKALWDNVANKKQYITGGIGDSVNNNEGFEDEYKLPNYKSYCETCAGVANMLWNRSMSKIYDGSQYADQIETDLYNNVLGCVNFNGDKFYYENRICTVGAFDRSQWFGTACCPPNYTRTILQLGGYIYNTTSSSVYINQYFSNDANFDVNANDVNIKMTSNFPYDTSGSFIVKSNPSANFDIKLRKPSWSDGYTIKVAGQTISPKEKDGYIVIDNQTWSDAGTTIEFNFDMPLKYVKTDDKVESNQGLIALRHGPLFYCAEGCDNEGNFDFDKTVILQNGQYNFEPVKPLDNISWKYPYVANVSVLNHAGKVIDGNGARDVNWRLIPYYARCNRKLSSMHLFFHDGNQAIKTHRKATASASFTNKGAFDYAGGLNDGTKDADMRWTSWNGKKEQPETNPWVQYDFKAPVKIIGCNIWWYDDNDGVRHPDSYNFQVFNEQTSQWENVNVKTNDTVLQTNSNFEISLFDKTYEFKSIRVNTVNEKTNRAVGIVEWELIDDQDYGQLCNIEVTKQPNKQEYQKNEEFEKTGMIVKANYLDKNSTIVSKEITNYTVEPVCFENLGPQDVKITYVEQGTLATSNVTVNVNEPASPDNPGASDLQTQNISTDIVSTGDNLAEIFVLLVLSISLSVVYLLKKSRFTK